jgi:hypothetical protein
VEDIVKVDMEIRERLSERGEKGEGYGSIKTLEMVNSAGSGLIFARISYSGENPLKYTDPDGNDIISYWMLQLLSGGNADKLLEGISNAKSWLDFTDKIYFNAVMLPVQTINTGSTIVKYAALFGGNVPVAGTAGAIQATTDNVSLAIKIAYAWSIDSKEAWVDVMSDVASMAIGAFISTTVDSGIASVKVRVSTKNGGYYQIGRRGRMSDVNGFITKLSQDLGIELGKDLSSQIVADIKKMLLQEEKK